MPITEAKGKSGPSAPLVTTNDIRDINRAILSLLKGIQESKSGIESLRSEIKSGQKGKTPSSGSQGAASSGAQGAATIPTVPHKFVIPATNPDHSIQTDAEGCALMQVVTIKEPAYSLDLPMAFVSSPVGGIGCNR